MSQNSERLDEVQPLRMLVAPAVELWICLFAAVMAIVTVRNAWAVQANNENAINPVHIPFWILNGGLAIVALGAAFYSKRIKQSLHIVCDVVTHFAMPEAGFPVREQIASRFINTIDFLTQDREQVNPHLLIIAHSQGTVVVLDQFINGLWKSKLQDHFKSVTLLTFGSPFTHVYQHYFPHVYPSPATRAAFNLPEDEKLFKWCNVYRIDDYIGTKIDNDETSSTKESANSCGGHNRYWESPIFDSIRKLLPK